MKIKFYEILNWEEPGFVARIHHVWKKYTIKPDNITINMGFRKWHIFFNMKYQAGTFLKKRKIMTDLKEKHCTACEEGTEPLNAEQIEGFMIKLHTKWEVVDNKMLRKEFPFENFKRGMAFAQNVALLADKEGHHPDMCIHYKSVDIELSTHSIKGLSESDFIMAAKIDEL